MCTQRRNQTMTRRKTGSDETISMFKPHHHTRSIYDKCNVNACDRHPLDRQINLIKM